MAEPTAPDQPKTPLLDEFAALAGTLLPHEIPHSGQVPHLLGALVKVLEHEGTKIAEDLWPKEPAPPVRAPETPGQAAEFDDLLTRFRAIVDAAEQKTGVSAADVPPTPAEPASSTVPPAPPAPETAPVPAPTGPEPTPAEPAPTPTAPDSAPSTPAESLPANSPGTAPETGWSSGGTTS